MVDVHSPRVPLTVQLPAELVEELQTLAGEEHVSIDDLVMEACLEFTEPRLWEREYRAWSHRPGSDQ